MNDEIGVSYEAVFVDCDTGKQTRLGEFDSKEIAMEVVREEIRMRYGRVVIEDNGTQLFREGNVPGDTVDGYVQQKREWFEPPLLDFGVVVACPDCTDGTQHFQFYFGRSKDDYQRAYQSCKRCGGTGQLVVVKERT